MKKVLGLFFIVVLVLVVQVFGTSGLMEFYMPCEQATYVLITTENVATNLPVTQTQNGNNVILTTNANHAKTLFFKVPNVVGEAWEFKTTNPNFLVKQLKKQLQFNVLSECVVGDVLVIDAYTNQLPYAVNYHNLKQNLQIAVLTNKVIVGSPFILHSY